jgi:hypothetical protein
MPLFRSMSLGVERRVPDEPGREPPPEAPPPTTVLCLSCAQWFRIPNQASILTCPRCYKRVRVESLVVDRPQMHARLETCGVITVKKRGILAADLVRAGAGIVIEPGGRIQVSRVESYRVILHDKAIWQGDCEAASLHMEPGAVVLGGRFTIRPCADEPGELIPSPGDHPQTAQPGTI